MRQLSALQQASIVEHLVEGASVRGTARLCQVDKESVMAVLLRIGAGCERLHNRMIRDLMITRVECDEIWSYVHTKEKRVKATDPAEFGDAWTYVAMGSISKLIISYRVGKRDQENTDAFIADVRARLLTIAQLSTDGFKSYESAVGHSFGTAVDYGQVVKNYTSKGKDYDRYAPPAQQFIVKRKIAGAPDMAKVSTSLIERQNLTIRMCIRRFIRRGNGFSKKLTHHSAAVALHFAWYNFCRIHETLRVTPCMEAGITSHVWSVAELLETVLAEVHSPPPEPKPLRPRDEAPGPVRELPGARGWLRVIPGGKAGPGIIAVPGAAKFKCAAPVKKAPRRMEQLDLFDPPKKD